MSFLMSFTTFSRFSAKFFNTFVIEPSYILAKGVDDQDRVISLVVNDKPIGDGFLGTVTFLSRAEPH